jgi:hypothetical protein
MYLNDANFMVLFYKESPSEIYFWSFLCQHHNCIKSNKVHTLRSLPKKQKKKPPTFMVNKEYKSFKRQTILWRI